MNKEKLKEMFLPALKRAGWTMAQTAIAMIPVGSRIADLDWLDILSVCFVAGLLSLLKSVFVGMPETDTGGTLHIDTSDPKVNRYLMEYDDLDKLPDKKAVLVKIDTSTKLPAFNDTDDETFEYEADK